MSTLPRYKKFTEIYEIKNEHGHLVWRYATDNSIEIVDIEVDTPYRGMGYGTDLIEKLKGLANGAMIILFTKETNETAQKFYEKLGFHCGGKARDNLLYWI